MHNFSALIEVSRSTIFRLLRTDVTSIVIPECMSLRRCVVSRLDCCSTGRVIWSARLPCGAVTWMAEVTAIMAVCLACSATMQNNVSMFIAALAIGSVAGMHALWSVRVESLTLLPDIGLLLESHARCGLRLERRFVDLHNLSSVFIHEGLTASDIRCQLTGYLRQRHPIL